MERGMGSDFFGARCLTLSTLLLVVGPASTFWPHSLLNPTAASQGTVRRKFPTRYRTAPHSATVSRDHAPSSLDCERIGEDIDDPSFVSECGVPTWKAGPGFLTLAESCNLKIDMEALPSVPGAFVLRNVLSPAECENLIEATDALGFGNFDAGMNRHGALQVLVDFVTWAEVFRRIKPFLPARAPSAAAAAAATIATAHGWEEHADVADHGSTLCGINARWRFYKYSPNGKETFGPHVDVAWTGSGLDSEGKNILWDAFQGRVRSRHTFLLYLNHDFSGGETKFYRPLTECPEAGGGTDDSPRVINRGDDGSVAMNGGAAGTGGGGGKGLGDVIAAVRPQQGSVLIFPQVVGEEARDHARVHWPLHEGAPLWAGPRAKYVLRSDVLYRDD